MKARGEPLLTLAMTYPFSSHNYEFRYWLAAGGIDPDCDVKLVVVPPPLTSDALATGAIDGFCVGAPWNMVASERAAQGASLRPSRISGRLRRKRSSACVRNGPKPIPKPCPA